MSEIIETTIVRDGPRSYSETLTNIVLTAQPPAIDMRDIALEEMRNELADVRAERDRYVARCRDLETRLALVREVVR